MSRWGKPRKNTKRIDPRYFMNEKMELLTEDATGVIVDIAKLYDLLPDSSEAEFEKSGEYTARNPDQQNAWTDTGIDSFVYSLVAQYAGDMQARSGGEQKWDEKTQIELPEPHPIPEDFDQDAAVQRFYQIMRSFGVDAAAAKSAILKLVPQKRYRLRKQYGL
jgi:hypothetical protein